MAKTLFPVEVHEYLVAHGTPPDAVQRELIAETSEVAGGLAIMQIAPEQGAFMEILARTIGARRAVEVGTFTGYSSLCLARGMPDDGRLLCCDVSREWTDIATKYWEKAGVAHKIDLRIAPAIETLRSFPEEEIWDLAFIDADKSGYIDYYEAILPRLRTGGVGGVLGPIARLGLRAGRLGRALAGLARRRSRVALPQRPLDPRA